MKLAVLTSKEDIAGILALTNIYDFVLCLSKEDIAGILACCGYAIRESITLFDALEEMGFGIDTSRGQDIYTEQKLALLALFCVEQLSKIEVSHDL